MSDLFPLVFLGLIMLIAAGILVRDKKAVVFWLPLTLLIIFLISTALFVFSSFISDEKSSLVLLATGLIISAFFVIRLIEAHQRALFELEFIDCLSFMTTLFDNGVPLMQAIELSAVNSKRHLRNELTVLLDSIRSGQSVTLATRLFAERHKGATSALFAEIVAAAYTDGIEMNHLARELVQILVERKRQRSKFYQAMNSIRFAAVFALVMPYVTLTIFIYFLPHWLSLLLDKYWGSELIVGAILLQLVGIIWLFTNTSRRLSV